MDTDCNSRGRFTAVGARLGCLRASRWLAACLLVVTMAGRDCPGQPPAGEAVGDGPRQPSLLRLAEPEIADSVGLSDEQRGQVSEILARRDEALQAATPEEQPAVIAAAEAELDALLTDEQRTAWAELAAEISTPRLPQLRFNFRFAPWADVLTWFADQSGLSLVLDAPPPGTFNYTDTREFTPAEAIDLLNGVLLTKGYTLIRRERMLLVLELEPGLPIELVPTVTLEELSERGRFEWITVKFTIGKRDPQAVQSEIEPLLGDYGKSVLLPQTKQLVVTETAGKMMAIEAIIESIPEPQDPKPEPPKPEPEKPVFQVHALGSVEPEAALEMLAALFSSARIVHDARTNQLLVITVPSQHEAIQQTIVQMQSEQPTELKYKLEVYPLVEGEHAPLVELFARIVPEAQVALDAGRGNLVVWAPPNVHETIRNTLAGIERAAGTEDDQRYVRAYRLRGHDVSALQTIVQALVARATVTIDTTSQSVVVLGNDAEQEVVAATIEGLRATVDEEEIAELRAYPVPERFQSQVSEALSTLVDELPGMRVLPAARPDRVVIWARAAQHEAIRPLVAQLIEDVPEEERPQLVAYRLAEADASTVLDVLQSLVPEAQLVVDPATNQIVAVATVDVHEKIRSALQNLDRAEIVADGDRDVRAYPLADHDPSALQSLVQALVPSATVTVDTVSSSLVVLAADDEHTIVAATIEQLRATTGDADGPTLRTYAVDAGMAATLLSGLGQLAPTATAEYDRQRGQLVVVAKLKDHAAVAAALDELAANSPEDPATFETYTVPERFRAQVTEALSALDDELPGLRVLPTGQPDRLVIWARAAQHEAVRPLIAQLTEEVAEDEQSRLVGYQLAEADASTILSALQSLVPDAQLVVDAAANQIIAFARPQDHERLQAAVDALDVPAISRRRLQLMTHPMGEADSAAVMEVLQTIVPDARLTQNAAAGTVIVLARAEDQQLVKETIERMQPDESGEARRRVATYRLRNVDPQAYATALGQAFPKAQITPDTTGQRLIVWATDDDQETIAAAVERLADPHDGRPREAVVYPVDHVSPGVAVAALVPLFPDALIQSEPDQRSVVALASAEDHQAIRAVIDQLDLFHPSDSPHQLVPYPLNGADSSSATTLILAAYPDARVVPDTRTDTLLVWTRGREHEGVRRMMENLVRDVPAERRRTTRAYALEHADPASSLPVFTTLVPAATLVADPTSRRLIATALPEEHERLAEAVAELDDPAAEGGAAALEVYALATANPESVLATLEQMFATRPEVRLTLDARTRKIAVWANAQVQETVRQVIEQLDTVSSPDEALQVEVYALGTADSEAVDDVLEELLEAWPEVRIVSDQVSHQLVVLARPEQHATVRATIEQFQQAQLTVDVIQLHTIDSFTAELAVERLFDADDRSRGSSAPRVESDPSTQQLFIRGTEAQIAEVRKLLAKMGEPLAADLGDSAGRTLRVIPLPQRALPNALEEVKRLWPQLRSNPIRVVTPSALSPTLRNERQQPDEDKAEPNEDEGAALQPAGNSLFQLCCFQEGVESEDAEDEPADDSNDETETQNDETVPPIVITVGPDRITIASDDVEALDQFEALLRSIIASAPPGGREFTVFTLQSANAALVADSLNKLFDEGFFGLRSGSGVTIVPDQRLNALIVQASPGDMATIESLLEVLDTSELPETLIKTQPRLIPLTTARAADVEDVLQDVYKTQLTPGQGAGARPQLRVPRGASGELQAVLAELNAAAAAPEMTLGVDRDTNSLVVLAAPPLFEEVKRLVEELDQAAIDSTQVTRVVPLRETSGEALYDTLRDLLRDSQRRSFRSRSD